MNMAKQSIKELETSNSRTLSATTQGEIILYQPDETISLEVQLEDDTVWLTQAQMAELFQRDQSVIARHISNIYKEEELTKEGTYAKFAYMGHDGLQRYEVMHYNLDVIISVGYRVKSKRGTKFRQWANRVIKEYMLRGYAINQQLLSMEQRIDSRLDNRQYPPVTVNVCQRNHDRFLIIDDEVYAFGASLKDAGKKLFAYIKMNETSASDLLSRIR